MENLKNRKFAKSLYEAKKIFKAKTGVDYIRTIRHHSGLNIYTLTKKSHPKKTKTRTHFIGSYMERINL